MDAELRAKIKAWPERQEARMAMVNAIEEGDIPRLKELLGRFPLIDHLITYSACWSELAAAAGQLELMKFWHSREKKSRPIKIQASLESLLFWSIGDEYIKWSKGDSVR